MREEEQGRPWTGVLLLLRGLVLLAAVALVLPGLSVRPASAEALPAMASAEGARMVIPMGRAVGIKLFSDGVLVVGLSDVTGQAGETSPARSCGLRQGDIITHINDTHPGRGAGPVHRPGRRLHRRHLPPGGVDPGLHGRHRHHDLL